MNCIICSAELKGRQQLYCSPRCRKRRQRHPEDYPIPESLKPKATRVRESEPELINLPPVGGSLERAVREDDELGQLRALRLRIAREIDVCEAPQLIASLSARFVETVVEIEKRMASTKTKESALNELARRRAQRQNG